MLDVMKKMQYVDHLTAEQIRSTHKGDPDWENATPGVYMGGVFCNDFLTRRVFRAWIDFITDPFNIMFFVGIGVFKSKTWGPNEVAKNVGGELLFGFFASLFIFVIPFVIAVIADLFFFIPHILYFRMDAEQQYDQFAAEYKARDGSTIKLDKELTDLAVSRINMIDKAIAWSRPMRF